MVRPAETPYGAAHNLPPVFPGKARVKSQFIPQPVCGSAWPAKIYALAVFSSARGETGALFKRNPEAVKQVDPPSAGPHYQRDADNLVLREHCGQSFPAGVG